MTSDIGITPPPPTTRETEREHVEEGRTQSRDIILTSRELSMDLASTGHKTGRGPTGTRLVTERQPREKIASRRTTIAAEMER
ncbi:unnamed protein product [Lampetra fluviatilis]